jgi:hypothetical protein
MLEPDGKTEQALGRPSPGTLDRRAMLDEALGSTRLVARVKRRSRAATSNARARPSGTTNESIPPAAAICDAATLWPGSPASPG